MSEAQPKVKEEPATTTDVQPITDPRLRASLVATFPVESSTSANVLYLVQLKTSDFFLSEETIVLSGPFKWTCTCKDFQYRGESRPCKHILSVDGK